MCSIQYEPCDDNSFGIGPQMTQAPLSNPTNGKLHKLSINENI